jgi:hypothetical protein
LEVDADNLREGLLGLVVALVEVIAEVLKTQAVQRCTNGSLPPESVERLGQGIMDIEDALEKIKRENGLAKTVQEIRVELDDVIDQLLDTIILPIDRTEIN